MKYYILKTLRIFLAAVFILYATIKFLGIQFPKMQVDDNINNVDSVTLLGYFFGYSQPYMLTVATGEFFAGILVAIPKTAKIGLLFYFSFALNVAAINWCFGLPLDVKVLSTFLALASLYLLINDWSSYKKLLQ